MYTFNAEKTAKACIDWIRGWFEQNGPDCKAVIGLSGGKDSSVAAALCVKALGKERVLGVLMPNGYQDDIDFAYGIAEHLGIEHIVVDIKSAVDGVYAGIGDSVGISAQTRANLPARIRMSTLYAISQSVNGRVVNTCNKSEDWVGYSTRYGDSVGDFSPLSELTVTEVKAIGRAVGIPEQFIEKPPVDGLTGKTDEENLGFTYAELDRYIREGVIPPAAVRERIDTLHARNLFKLQLMPVFPFKPE